MGTGYSRILTLAVIVRITVVFAFFVIQLAACTPQVPGGETKPIPEEILQLYGTVCNRVPSNQLESISQNTADAERCVPVVNLELGLDLDPAKRPYSLDGIDADHFILDNDTLTIQWNKPNEAKELRLYTVIVNDKNNNLQVTIKMEAALPKAILVLFQSLHNLKKDDSIHSKIDPRDFTRFYVAVNGKTLGIKFLPDKTFHYIQLDCEAISCVNQFPPDFSYLENLPDSDLTPLLLYYSLFEQERCHPVSPSNQRGKDHEYVVTRVDNDNKALNGDPAFMFVDSLNQALCFADTYLHENHETIAKKPVTTQGHRNSLPNDMFYPKSQYDLVFNADFDDIPNNYNRSELQEKLANVGLIIGPVEKTKKIPPSLNTADKADDPVFVRDGKLWRGRGLRGEIIPNSNPEARYECNPNKSGLTDAERIETYNPDKCKPIAGGIHMFAPFFKYGFAEINFSKMPTPRNGFAFWIQLLPFFDSVHKRWRYEESFAAAETGGTWPYKVDNRGDWPDLPLSSIRGDIQRFKMETHVHGSEVQLMEMSNNNLWTPNPSFWSLNHYGYSYKTRGNARWYYTVYTEDYRTFVYGIEWTPQGYIIWHKINGQDWKKVSTSSFVSTGNRGPSNQCNDHTKGNPKSFPHKGRTTIGMIQCGINHVAHSIYFSPFFGMNNGSFDYTGSRLQKYMCIRYYGINGTGAIPNDSVCKSFPVGNSLGDIQRNKHNLSDLSPKDLFIAYDSIRIYQPKSKYSDVPKLHQ